MTIASEIQRVQTNIANAYTSLEAKGATMPDTRNSANLASTINSVPSGSSGNIVEAIALGAATTAQEGDKVVLNNAISANMFLMDNVQSGQSTPIRTVGEPVFGGGSVISVNSILASIKDSSSNYHGNGILGVRVSDSEWSLSSFISPHMNWCHQIDAKRGICCGGTFSTSSSPVGTMVGFLKDGIFNYQYQNKDGSGCYSGFSVNLCNNLISSQMADDSSFILDVSKSVWEKIINIPSGQLGFLIYYNNSYYAYNVYKEEFVLSEDKTAWTKTGFTCSGFDISSASFGTISYIRYLGGDYSGSFLLYARADNSGHILKRVFGTPGVSNTVYQEQAELSKYFHFDNKLVGCDVQHDDTDGYTYIFMMDYSGKNVLARFKNGSVESLQPPFDSSSLERVCSASMNWYDRLFYCGTTDNSTTSYLHVNIKSNDVVAPYQFCSLPYSERYVVSETLTGYVKLNEGQDDFGNTILKVNTVTDPNAEPWTDVGKLYGFNVSVEEGSL